MRREAVAALAALLAGGGGADGADGRERALSALRNSLDDEDAGVRELASGLVAA